MAEHLLYIVRQTIESRDERVARSYSMYIAVDPAAEATASAFLAAHGAGVFVVVNIASAEPWREWPWNNCAEVLRALLPRWPELTFVLTPPPGKIESAERVVGECGSDRVIVFPPSPRFLDLVALVGRARLALTPDTASVHVASACRRPVVALYSSLTSPTRLWSPLGVPARLVEAGPGQPVSAITPEQVVDACEELYVETEPPLGRHAVKEA